MKWKSLYCLVFAVTLGFGWWPFNFRAANDLRWDAEEGALHFHERFAKGSKASRGIAFADDELQPRRWPEISVLIECRGQYNGMGLGTALELRGAEASGIPDLLVAQWLDHLAVRSKRSGDEWVRGYAEIGQRESFSGTQTRRILLSSGARGTTLYVDSMEPQFHRNFRLLDPDKEIGGLVVLGNSANGRQPFVGAMYRVAIYDRMVNPGALERGAYEPVFYRDFAQAPDVSTGSERRLVAPEPFRPLQREYFTPIDFERSESGMVFDVVINVIGFMPFGACAALLLANGRRRRWGRLVMLSLFTSFFFSFAIEFAQAYLPSRDSSSRDLLFNAVGGTLGGLAVALFAPRQRSGTIELTAGFRQ